MSPHRRRSANLLLAGLFLLSPSVVAGQPPAAPEGSSFEAPAAGDPTRVAATERFRFHSDPWVNLHHVLYFVALTEEDDDAAAQAAEAGEEHRRRRIGDGPDDLGRLDERPEAERKSWRRAVDFYRTHLAEHDLLFGRDMVDLRNALARGGPDEVRRAMKLESGTQGAIGALPAKLPDVLEGALPIYRAHLWPAHDRRNRAWVADVLPTLERLAPALAPGVVRAYGGAWPQGEDGDGLRIGVSVHAGWAGAYSSWHPDHIVISSTSAAHAANPDSEGEGYIAVESLFHEASHSRALGQELNPMTERAFQAAGLDEPPDGLWHGLLFYTAGELTRQALAARGEPGYVGYALRYGLTDRSPGWKDWFEALDEHWRPFLAGEAEEGETGDASVASAREAALAAAAKAFVQGSGDG